jgi:hypothetical protein
MGEYVRDLTPGEAALYACDPRNDNGREDWFLVMAQNYDQDCPNIEDHDPDGTCHCWDGITAEDVETWTEDGKVDLAGFAEWGPFQLWADADPGAPRAPDDMPIDQAIGIILSRLEVVMDLSPSVKAAMDRLGSADLVEDVGEVEPRGHVMGHNLCVYCLQYDEDPHDVCPERPPEPDDSPRFDTSAPDPEPSI